MNCSTETTLGGAVKLRRAKYPSYLRRYWGDEEPYDAVVATARILFKAPAILPLTRISGVAVFPIIEFIPSPAVSAFPTWSSITAPALRIAFASASPLARAGKDLSSLTAFGPAFAVSPWRLTPSFFAVSELDYRGVGLYRMEGGRAIEVLAAAPGPHPDADVAPHWRSERENQLMSFARETQITPTVEGWVASQAPRKSGGSQENPVESATS
jgi:hypothetical protein